MMLLDRTDRLSGRAAWLTARGRFSEARSMREPMLRRVLIGAVCGHGRPVAPATFLGIQPGFQHLPAIELYNLTSPLGEYPAGSTLSRTTIERMGYSLPARTQVSGFRSQVSSPSGAFPYLPAGPRPHTDSGHHPIDS